MKWSLIAKRTIDLVGAMVVVVVAAPVMLVVAAAVWLTMGRPVLFRQQRAGYKGRPFTLLKFRTMREAQGPDGKPLPDGRRLTGLGRLLRRTSLDELPQVFNVLGGSMSLVGPRPLLMRYLDRYTPQQARRHDAKPGVTGWAQVNGRNALEWDEKFRLDVWYVDHWSLRLDAWIVLRTIWKVVRPEGVSHAADVTMPEFMGSANEPRSNVEEGVLLNSAMPNTAVSTSRLARPLAAGARPAQVPGLNIRSFATQEPITTCRVTNSPVRQAAESVKASPAGRGGQLAIDGGAAVRTRPFPSWPAFDDRDLEVVAEVLRSRKVNYWTGRQGRLFEEEFAEQVGCRHAVAVANGTVALELALYALGIGPGDEVIVPARSFIASASCCTARGAEPVFADVDPNSQNLTAETARAVLSPKTKAIIAVHLAGWPCEMDGIMELAERHDLAVIEDCAQAHGATYRGRPVGSLGHVAAFSFCQDKIITTGGEGGMLTTNDPDLWKKAWSYKDHGKDWDALRRPNPSGVFQWIHASLGTNWRLTEMQSALGRAGLRKLPTWLDVRRRNAALLGERLSRLPALRVPVPPGHADLACYKQYVFLRRELLAEDWSRDRIVQAVQSEGIPCGSGICPEIYLEEAFAGRGLRGGSRLPNAEQLGRTSLMLQVHPTLARDDVLDTCRALEKVISAATVDNPAAGTTSPLAAA